MKNKRFIKKYDDLFDIVIVYFMNIILVSGIVRAIRKHCPWLCGVMRALQITRSRKVWVHTPLEMIILFFFPEYM